LPQILLYKFILLRSRSAPGKSTGKMLALSLHWACIAIGLALGAKDLQSSVRAYLRGFFCFKKTNIYLYFSIL
jgi:hypothetical protein